MTAIFAIVATVAILLFFPPARDWFFGHKIWPFPTRWDITPGRIDELECLAQPGDIIVERNLHSWHWMAICQVFIGSSWVHVAIVEQRNTLINMSKVVKRETFAIYLDKQSTDMCLIRPPYRNRDDIENALNFARSKIGTTFDPTFDTPDGNCAGLIATSLRQAGITIPTRQAMFFNKPIYAAEDFMRIPGAHVIWRLH